MRKLLVTLDDDLDKALAGVPNQNEVIRQALRLYMQDISTPDTIAGLRKSYKQLQAYMETHFEVYDYSFKQLDKLVNVLETRM